jgi:hypothetical protein
MNATLRSSLAAPLRQSNSLLRKQVLTRPIQRTLTTTPHTSPIIPNVAAPLKSQHTKAERRIGGTAAVAAGTACIGAGLYYYVSNEIDAIEEAF